MKKYCDPGETPGLRFTVPGGGFAVSAFGTDYIPVKKERVPYAVEALTERGCTYIEQKKGF